MPALAAQFLASLAGSFRRLRHLSRGLFEGLPRLPQSLGLLLLILAAQLALEPLRLTGGLVRLAGQLFLEVLFLLLFRTSRQIALGILQLFAGTRESGLGLLAGLPSLLLARLAERFTGLPHRLRGLLKEGCSPLQGIFRGLRATFFRLLRQLL